MSTDNTDLTIAQAAVQLGFTKQQTLNRVKRGVIHGTKVGWIWTVTQAEVKRVKQIKNSK